MKLFTVEEANALLPQVRSIVRRIQRAHAQLAARREEAQAAASRAELGGGGIACGADYVRHLQMLAAASSALETLGVQIKDYERGLVDFPSLREGRVVLLCWHAGEGDRVEFWHETDAGFAGRQPL